MRVVCNLCSGVIYHQEIPRHFSQCHADFCEVKKWPQCFKCPKGFNYFPDEKSLQDHSDTAHNPDKTVSEKAKKGLKRPIPTPVPILPKPVTVSSVRPELPAIRLAQPKGAHHPRIIRVPQPKIPSNSQNTISMAPRIVPQHKIPSNSQNTISMAPRIVIQQAPPTRPRPSLQIAGQPPGKIIRLAQGQGNGLRPMTKITFPIPAEFKMGNNKRK